MEQGLRQEIQMLHYKQGELEKLREQYMHLGGILVNKQAQIQELRAQNNLLKEDLLNIQVKI